MITYLSKLLDNEDPVIIMPFTGYANAERLYGQARVLEDEGIANVEAEGVVGNLYRSFKRFETDEIHGAKVHVSWPGGETTLISDKEGYVYLDVAYDSSLCDASASSIPLTYSLIERGEISFTITSSVIRPLASAQFGVISDMDETVLHTGLDSFLRWKVIVSTMFTDSTARMPLEGVRDFYAKLAKGFSEKGQNPFFYLSNSPWNLYDYLQAFLEGKNFPKGPLLLRDIGLENKRKDSFLEGNKFIKISHILQTYPKLPFLLIGDGEDLDPEIYLEIAKRFPNQVATIYIRSVSDKRKTKRIVRLKANFENVDIKLISHTNEAILHAIEKGYIKPQ